MHARRLLRIAATAALLAAVPAQAGRAPRTTPATLPVPGHYVPPRTPWGDPDLRGTWPLDHLAFLLLQRAPQRGDQPELSDAEIKAREAQIARVRGEAEAQARKGVLTGEFFLERTGAGRRAAMLTDPPNGRLPELTEEGKRRTAATHSIWIKGQPFDWVDDFDSWNRCITVGFPAVMLPRSHDNGIRLFQSPGYVVIDLELIHNARVIPLKRAAPWPPAVKSWMGNSRAHWDRDTLVIETDHIRSGAAPLNFATLGAPPNNTIPTSDQARVVERLTMTAPDTISYEMTYSDPVIWTAPFTVRLDWQRDERYRLYEYACHEGNRVVRDNIVASREQRGKGAPAK